MAIFYEHYWEELQLLARKHKELVTDYDAWQEPFVEGKTAKEAFYEEYPEHKPKETIWMLSIF